MVSATTVTHKPRQREDQLSFKAELCSVKVLNIKKATLDLHNRYLVSNLINQWIRSYTRKKGTNIVKDVN